MVQNEKHETFEGIISLVAADNKCLILDWKNAKQWIKYTN